MKKIGLSIIMSVVLSSLAYGDCVALENACVTQKEMNACYIKGFFCKNNRDINAYDGNEDALTNIALADLYENGIGLEQNDFKAAKFYEKGCEGVKGILFNATDQDISLSCYNAAVYYQEGRGVNQDYKKAIKLFRKATDKYFYNTRFDLNKYFE
ncbi:hypothetical protein [Sulfurimonas sp.]|uniref:tetratricopeptide repeat protein n=1 Tax=Sulfurimonas sp. TaxID=2022749 RepID=UPI001A0CF5DC|nr:hypothetical protein [Sulfurimonas sp.]MBE0515202.1 sel1 repeat family protein [Sulfurimonas sp.]